MHRVFWDSPQASCDPVLDSELIIFGLNVLYISLCHELYVVDMTKSQQDVHLKHPQDIRFLSANKTEDHHFLFLQVHQVHLNKVSRK